MQNLIRLLIKHNSLFLFLFLEIVCLILIINFNREQSKIFTATSNAFSGWMYNITNRVTRIRGISDELNKVTKNNAELFERLEVSKFNNIIVSDTAYNQEYLPQYKYVEAEVVNNTTNRPNNYLTINRGKNHKIKKNCAVIGGNGIVGIVLASNEKYSIIMSLLHQQTKISVATKKAGFFGSLIWSGTNSTIMDVEAIPKHAAVEIGDTIVTSGYSSMFPKEIIVGVIDKIEEEKGSPFHKIKVKLSEDLNRIKHVYVVQNLFQDDQLQLEKEIINEQ